ncbi:MAG: protein-L-isoaspartate O-methyltransferase [Steroidobacteraceae bacterium]
MLDLTAARRQMIEQQVRAWDVLDDAVLGAMGRVRREEFAPPAYRDIALADTTVPLAHGECMLAPSVEGRILQSLAIQPGDEILEVGTGSGWFAAVLGALGRQVRSLEIHPDLAESARANLEVADVGNVVVETADAMRLDDDGRYDVIAVTGSLPVYDVRFERALKVGGRLFAVVGAGPAMEARLITRQGHAEWLREDLFETSIPPLLHAPRPPRFEF